MRIARALLVAGITTLLGCAPDAAAGPSGGRSPSILPIAGDAGVECVRPEEGCACDPGQPPIDCYLDAIDNGDGTLTCNRGTRYCRDGAWTTCESIREYVTGGTGAALITGPDICNPCDPRCFATRDTPTPGDLAPGNSSSVSYDPGRGGIELTPLPPMPEMLADSDGDGIPDVADECVGAGAFRNADGTCYGDDFIYHTLPFGASAIDPLDIQTQIRTADVYFLMDTTGSMGGELVRLQNDLTSGSFLPGCSGGIMGAIRCTMPDAWFGVGRYDDYPVDPYGGSLCYEWYYWSVPHPLQTGCFADVPYQHIQDITSSLSANQAAMNSLRIHWGNDGPESATQALYSLATGSGLGSYVAARTSCAAGRWGYPCFRDGTIPIVIHVTDAPFHNGPSGHYPYSGISGAASWSSSVAALNARNVRVITMQTCGTWSDSYCQRGEQHADALGNATGSVASSGPSEGEPFVFRGAADGSGLGAAVVDAVVDLANFSRMDVSARAVGDTRGFTNLPITAVSWGPRGECTGISGGSTFVQCLPGTDVNFRVTFRNDVVMPTMTTQVFSFFIEIIGDGSIVLGRVPVRIVVPALVEAYPASGSYWHDYDSTVRCAINERPDWGSLSWTADVPTGTRIEFELRAADTAAGLSSATPARITVPTATSPRDIAAALRAAGYPDGMRHLRVTAVLHSDSARTASPALTDMSVQYTCVPAE